MSSICSISEENQIVIEPAWVVAVMDQQQACLKNNDHTVVWADQDTGDVLEEGSCWQGLL